jgi:hypothetical protein
MFNWKTIAEIATRALFLLGDVNNKKYQWDVYQILLRG